MDISPIELYFIFQADYIRGFLIFLSVVSGFIVFSSIISIAVFNFCDFTFGLSKKFLFYTLPFFLLCSFSATFIPSTKTMVAIYVIPMVAEIDGIEKLPKNLVNTLNDMLENYVADINKDG